MALQGTLDTFALADVLRLLAATAKTGRLQVSGDRGDGELWLADGAVVGGMTAAAGEAASADVAFELLRHQEGSFEFVGDDTTGDGREPQPVDAVIEQAEAKLDDWHAVEAVVPSLHCSVVLAEQLRDDEIVLGRDRWRTLVAVGEGRTVGAVAEWLELGEIDGSKAVRDLVEAGLAIVGAPTEPAADVDVDVEPTSDEHDDTQYEAGPGADGVTDLDEAVRAELYVSETVDPRAYAGSTEVDIDGRLDVASHDHAYLAAGAAGLPEPLPADLPEAELADDVVSAELAPIETDPFLRPAPEGDGPEDEPGEPDEPAADHLDPPVEPAEDPSEVARQLASLSPRAAQAIAEAAAAPVDAKGRRHKHDKQEEPMNRNLLKKFISSK